MKALRSSFLVLSGFFFAVLLLGLGLHVRAGGAGPPTTTESGDVNGDRQLDIADVVYTLVHLFKGGPAPVACADSAELVGRVAALEATVARLELDAECAPDRRSPDRFIDQGDGTVLDPCTGLVWSQSIADTNGDEALTPADAVTWVEADAYCAALELGGKGDWRLPSVNELASLIRCSACAPLREWPRISPFRFKEPYSPPYCWTRDPHPSDPVNMVYQVNLGIDGASQITSPAPKTEGSSYFLAVRGP